MINTELIDVLDFNKLNVKVLLISCSPRVERRSRSYFLMQEAMSGAQEVEGVEVMTYSFSKKKITPYRECVESIPDARDDFPELRDKWLKADAVIWSVPVYHMGPPSLVRAAMNRLSAAILESNKANKMAHLPRFNKVVGAIVQGGSRFGGQEITLLYFMQHAFQMRCIWVTADMPESYHGVAVHVTTDEALQSDQDTIDQCRILGRRIVETAKFVKAGLMLTADSLPDEYFPSRTEAGKIDRSVFIC